ncbi:MAG: methyltransferase domain-containing protein [Erysipelotrichaceae bacterium]|nr:methyltransferase domain-containing protein [Erysipelotrichaceae bacterium]
MSKKASQFQVKAMSIGYRGKGIFKPLNTGRIDEHVACVREWIANIFFYTKNGTTIMIDAGYSYERLAEKMSWLNIDPASVEHIFITHQDTDHVGALETDSAGLFRNAKVYLSRIENRYLTREIRRKVIYGAYKLPYVNMNNGKVLLEDGQIIEINGIKVECILVPGHTWGHMVYLIDDEYLFTGDTLWFGADGGYSFINSLAEDNQLAVSSLKKLQSILKERNHPVKIITGHTGWTSDMEFAFAHIDRICNSLEKQKPFDPTAPYDGYDESDDTKEKAETVMLAERSYVKAADYKNWMPKGMIASFAAASALSAGGAVACEILMDESKPLLKKAAKTALNTSAIAFGAASVWCTILYNAFSYEGKRKLSKQIIDGTASYIHIPEGGRGLDVGCGSGALSIAAAKANPKSSITGIDTWGPEYASFNQKRCEENAAAEGVSNVSFQHGNAIKLDFEDETFDAVMSNYVYHNISGHDKQQLLRETLRVLKKGGTFAIHDIMSKARYGDMEKFVRELREEGYEEVHLIHTDNGMFMSKKEGIFLGLSGSALLMGKK